MSHTLNAISVLFAGLALKGYKNIIIHVSLLEIIDNAIFSDLREKHHVIHSTLLDIVTLPVIPVVAFTPL